MKEPGPLEEFTGGVLAKAGLTLIATALATPLAALLPVLTDSLAARRHAARIRDAIRDIEAILSAHEEKLKQITDAQYKLINEVILTVLQNTEEAKLSFLRNAIISGVEAKEIPHTVAAQVSRALRDMTAGELSFVIEHSASTTIMVGPVSLSAEDNDQNIYVVDRHSDEISYVSGLLGLGILIPAGSTIDDGGRYVFAPFVATLRKFVQG